MVKSVNNNSLLVLRINIDYFHKNKNNVENELKVLKLVNTQLSLIVQ